MGKIKTDDWTKVAVWNGEKPGDTIVGVLESKKTAETRFGDQRVYRFILDGNQPCDFWGSTALDALMDANWTALKGKKISVTFSGHASDGRTKMWEIDDEPSPKARTKPAPRMPDPKAKSDKDEGDDKLPF